MSKKVEINPITGKPWKKRKVTIGKSLCTCSKGYKCLVCRMK